MKKKNPITLNYKKIRMFLKDGRIEEAKELIEWGLVYLANATIQKVQVIDKISVDLWKDRYWFELENNGLLEGDDVEYTEVEENYTDEDDETW
jgi:hypothetical protein